jgi:hypothetical protein
MKIYLQSNQDANSKLLVVDPVDKFVEHINGLEINWFENSEGIEIQTNEPAASFGQLLTVCANINLTPVDGKIDMNELFEIQPFTGFGAMCQRYESGDSYVMYEQA